MTSTRRFAGTLSAAMVSLLLAAACASPEAPGGTVKVLVSGAPEELEAFRTLAAAYESATPGSHVQLIEASDADDLITRLSTSLAGGAPPDVFLINYRFYGQFAARDAIEPVDQRLRDSTVIEESDFYPAPMAAFRWAGNQMCVPQNASSLVVYYNRTLFQKYGVAEPASGWTWNDMVATATALTRDANGTVVKGTEPEAGGPTVDVYGLGIEPQIIRVAPFVWSNGGTFLDDPQKPSRFTFDEPRAREALKNFLDLRLAYGVVPTDEEIEAEDAESRFANGRLAMLLQSRRVTPTFRTIKDFDWDVAPLPMYSRPVSVLHSDAYCITRSAGDLDSAWRFVEFAMTPQGQRIIAATGRTVPSHVDVSRSDVFLDSKAPSHASVFLDAIPTLQRVPTVSTWPEIEDVTNGILENALYRGDRLDDVIRELDAQTGPLFARAAAP